jgi:hypothetical protein
MLIILYLSVCSLLLKFAIFPPYDFPDLQAVIQSSGSYFNILPTPIQASILESITAKSCENSLDPLFNLVFGGGYNCEHNNEPIVSAAIFSIPYIATIALTYFLCFHSHITAKAKYIKKNTRNQLSSCGTPSSSRIISLIIFIFIPATPYFLASGHPETYVTFPYVVLQSLLIYKSSAMRNVWRWTVLLWLASLILFYLAQEKNILVSALICQSTILVSMKSFRGVATKIRSICINLGRVASLKTHNLPLNLIWVVVAVSIPFVLFYSLSYIYGNLLSGTFLELIASSYSSEGAYSDLLYKYGLPVRIALAIRSANIVSQRGIGPDIITMILFILCFMISLRRILIQGSSGLNLLAILAANLFTVAILISMFPVFVNFKYYLTLLPLFAAIYSYIPRTTFLFLSFSWFSYALRSWLIFRI